MRRLGAVLLLFLLLFGFAVRERAAPSAASPMMSALKAELTRTMDHLKKQPNPPYFLSYEVMEIDSTAVEVSFGSLVSSGRETHRRELGIDLRVGSYQLD